MTVRVGEAGESRGLEQQGGEGCGANEASRESVLTALWID